MTDLHQFAYWLVASGLLIALALLTNRRDFARRAASKLFGRLGAWALDQVRPEQEPDQLADDLARALRMERLIANVERLRRIVATDMAMSATRQIGNRLAYGWLLRELAEARAFGHPTGYDDTTNLWSVSATPIQTRFASGYQSQRPPQVEILDVRWGR